MSDSSDIQEFEKLVGLALSIGFRFIAFRKDEMIKALIFAKDEESADELVGTYVDGDCTVALGPERQG